MRHTRWVWPITLAVGATGCGSDPLVCTDEFVAVGAAIVNLTGQQLSVVAVHDTVLRTEAVLDISAEHPAAALPADGVSEVIIFSDAFEDAIRPAGEAVAVAVLAGDHSVSARYEFGTDGCHVLKLAGPDTLEVE